MNLEQIKICAERERIPFKVLASQIGMSEGNLHRCVRENKIQAGDLEKIAKILRVPVTVFFDEGRGGVNVTATDHSQAAGRDLHIGTSAKESELEKENQDLRQQLIDAQSKIIKLMEIQNKN